MTVADGITFVRVARRVREELGQRHRYAHVLRVARFAVRLARAHGLDVVRARTAGLLHDLARLYSADRLIAECEGRGMPIDAFEREHPVVLHARLGAELARERYGVEDEPILDAIRRHTLAAPHMSPLDAAIYLADSLEPGRDYADRAELAALAMRDLRAGLRATLESSFAYLRARGEEIPAQSLAALHELTPEAHVA